MVVENVIFSLLLCVVAAMFIAWRVVPGAVREVADKIDALKARLAAVEKERDDLKEELTRRRLSVGTPRSTANSED